MAVGWASHCRLMNFSALMLPDSVAWRAVVRPVAVSTAMSRSASCRTRVWESWESAMRIVLPLEMKISLDRLRGIDSFCGEMVLIGR